ncbi:MULTISPECIES: AraC family transcriptional regulator [unclassified Cupriavidus]|uniref:AraC family transcriptional regulator n=1 Tax=unclassified Cupriavidus TaxID=2640874 RepID=UPI001C00803D|nr:MULTISPECIES: AraC family transcriptional regulator [unclassified Cupriavidus]MCA3185684.1 AraC family transcriptional regulator [Cupriavidus sp.]MCA3191879.1 AraC family transcriptional regulator [Cupriavidus sp.]MCA3198110.1 AraC family transcriptional regulator [Cupriavidus sp.]MCA3200792.1 AraC family transcriptional regulator [Cupriavidus sp.]MCA3208557.1 AraC family transcriptional regulator [Cupriavidus sp.]
MKTLVRAAVLTNFLDVARGLGANPLPLLRAARLSPALLANPDQRIPAQACATLLEAAAAATACATFGLRMAESRQLSDFGVMSLLITQQATLRDALETIIRYRHLVNESVAILLETSGKVVVIRQEVVLDTPSRQATELALGVVFRLCRALLGPQWRPQSVNFAHVAPPDLQVHRRLFGCPLEFGSDFNGIVCLAADLDAPNPTGNPAMARHAERVVETLPRVNEASIGRDVRHAVYLMLPMGRATSEAVAQGLGMSLRTMQRQLDATGETFSDIVNGVRRDLAQRYVANPDYSLLRVSELLGYGSAAAFTRWFSAQFGEAPNAWRRRHAGPAAQS